MTTLDGHRYFLDVDPDGMKLRVECPFMAQANLTSRVCWPHSLDGVPDEPPQPICTFQQWVDEVDWTEILHGSFTAELGCDARWGSGSLELHITRTPHTWVTTPEDEQLELEPIPGKRATETIDASILRMCVP